MMIIIIALMALIVFLLYVLCKTTERLHIQRRLTLHYKERAAENEAEIEWLKNYIKRENA